MTREETEAELDEIRAAIDRLRAREAALIARLAGAEEESGPRQPRPGWPIERMDHDSGLNISTSASSRTAV